MKWTKNNGPEIVGQVGRVGQVGQVRQEPADRSRYTGTVYTPARLKQIFDAANSGDVEQLCICAREIVERNWDVIGALEQRADALLGVDFDIQPGGDRPEDILAARQFDRELREAGELNGLSTFQDLLSHLMSAVVHPFSASEIVWGPGGRLEGFNTIESHHFTLRDSFIPRLVCDEYPAGMPEHEARNRFVIHQGRKKADPARSGLIRVLAWLHVFQNYPIKDLFSFIERFGMPFLIAKVDQNAWENERAVLHNLIRNFGPNGGGVFTKATELQLLNASNTGSDNVYFRTLEFTHDAIYTLIVGQLASSGDAAGMSNGTAQTAVRQDILEADARSFESTIRAQIAAPWTAFHFIDAAVPRIKFKVAPAEDMVQLATVVNTLSSAGFKADEKELSERFGLKLHYEAPAAQPAGNNMAFSDRSDPASRSYAVASGSDGSDLTSALEEWLGPLSDGIAAAAELSDEELDRQLRKGLELQPGSSEKLEKAMSSDMEKAYGTENKG